MPVNVNFIPGTESNMPSGDTPVEKMIQRYAKAHRKRDRWLSRWQDCYDLALPNRDGFFASTSGESRSDFIFDSTAVHSTQNFASRIKSYTTPLFAHWSELRAGSEVPKEERSAIDLALDPINEFFFDVIQNSSNFDLEDHESNVDLAVGTGALLAEETEDPNQIVEFRAVPLPELILEKGPFSRIGGVFWPRVVMNSDIKNVWPKATFSDEMTKDIADNPDREVTIVVCTLEDRAAKQEEHFYTVMSLQHKHILLKEKFIGAGSNPWIIFRWSTSSGEVYGRGPLLNALPDIKVANLIVELTLENAESAIVGMWQYDDDTIINPHTVQMVAGTLIPVSAGSKGLQPLTPGGSFDLAQLILEDVQNKIRMALFDKPLGGLEQPVRSATEISERLAEFSRETGSPFGRIQTEKTQPIMRRIAYILKRGGKIDLPQINGREIKVHPVSPLGRAQEQQDIMNLDRFLEQVLTRFGPQVLNLMVEQEAVVEFLARKWGVSETLIRSKVDRVKLTEQMAQMAQGAMDQGVPPADIAKMAGAAGAQ